LVAIVFDSLLAAAGAEAATVNDKGRSMHAPAQIDIGLHLDYELPKIVLPPPPMPPGQQLNDMPVYPRPMVQTDVQPRNNVLLDASASPKLMPPGQQLM
jgi:hypothetical protein